ncbi:hypothetical protein ABFS83_06G152400 [Erythranthe nasuta]
MSPRMIKILLLLVLFIEVNILEDRFAKGCLFAYKRNIHIFNDLPPKSAPLKLHCWSKKDDLGYHTLDVEKEFEWTFCGNFSPSTLYTCQLWWGSKDRAFEVFDEKTQGMKSDRSVYWVAKNDGIYYVDDTPPFPKYAEKKYDWNN